MQSDSVFQTGCCSHLSVVTVDKTLVWLLLATLTERSGVCDTLCFNRTMEGFVGEKADISILF